MGLFQVKMYLYHVGTDHPKILGELEYLWDNALADVGGRFPRFSSNVYVYIENYKTIVSMVKDLETGTLRATSCFKDQ